MSFVVFLDPGSIVWIVGQVQATKGLIESIINFLSSEDTPGLPRGSSLNQTFEKNDFFLFFS
ncbi:MAG: hypothetical protein LBP27_07565 [Treponema sp.]|nr:hypothetical protein [Treponema sp.]